MNKKPMETSSFMEKLELLQSALPRTAPAFLTPLTTVGVPVSINKWIRAGGSQRKARGGLSPALNQMRRFGIFSLP